MIQIPVARGLSICEQVIVEENTKNITLVNVFTTMRVDQFPSESRRFYVVALLSDGLGEISLQVRMGRLDTFEIIRIIPLTMRFTDRTQEVRFLLRVNNCRFPVAGDYQVVLTANGQPIADSTIRVIS